MDGFSDSLKPIFLLTRQKNIPFKKYLEFFIPDYLNINTRARCYRIQ